MLKLTKAQLREVMAHFGQTDDDCGRVLTGVIGGRLPGRQDDGLYHVEPQYRELAKDETLPVFSLSALTKNENA